MTLRIWDVGSRRQLLHLNDVRVVSLRQQGGLAAAGYIGRQARVWTFRPSKVYDQLHGMSRYCYPFSFSPDGRWATVRGPDEELCLWDVPGHRLVGHWPELGMAVWGPEGTWLVAGGAKGLVRLLVTSVPGTGGTPAALRVGPARRLPGIEEDAREWRMAWLDPDRRRLGVKPGLSAAPLLRVIELGSDSVRDLGKASQPNFNYFSSSRDGRLVATGTIDGATASGSGKGPPGRC